MKTTLKANIVSKAEYIALLKSHQVKDLLLQYEEWRGVADQIQAYLETVGVEYSFTTEEGDFIVGADWWQDRCIDVSFISQGMISKSILQGLFALLGQREEDWVLNITVEEQDSTPVCDILICKVGAYVSVDEAGMEMTDGEGRPWLSLLQALCD